MKRYKEATYEIRLSAVKAVNKGVSVSNVSKCYGINPSTIHHWHRKYKERNKYTDLKTKQRTGRPRCLKRDDLKEFKKDILNPASKFGFETDFWTSHRLIQRLDEKYRIFVSKATMWRRLKEANLTYIKPEQRYYESDKKAQHQWIINELPIIKRIAKKHNAILYFEDEAIIQLAPIIGKAWNSKGSKAILKVTGNRRTIVAMSAISKSGHLIFTLHRNKITSFEVVAFLKQMLEHHPRRHLVVVMDRARLHTANVVKDFIKNQKRLCVSYLPSRSPELNHA